MNKNIKTIVIDKILELIPSHIKPVDYLSEVLDISRESAYRRLRGKMSFYFEELITLSELLGFSLDELVALKPDNTKVLIDIKINKDPAAGFLEKMERYKIDVDNRCMDKSSSSILALNYLPAEFCVHRKSLFKLSYYLWLHWKERGILKPKYSEIEISPELEELRRYIDKKVRRLENNSFILDPNVFYTPLKLVCYFRDLGLIDNENIKSIKEDLHNMINAIEREVRISDLHPEGNNYFYLSNFNIDVNSGYYTWNGNISSSFALNFFNRIVITNPEICEAHKEWFLSLKKYSTLISGSNEVAQAEYFKKQREYVNWL
jgi:DNA-directed RNA polymerase subunit F